MGLQLFWSNLVIEDVHNLMQDPLVCVLGMTVSFYYLNLS